MPDCLRRASPPHPRILGRRRQNIQKQRHRQKLADLVDGGGGSVRVESERLAEMMRKSLENIESMRGKQREANRNWKTFAEIPVKIDAKS